MSLSFPASVDADAAVAGVSAMAGFHGPPNEIGMVEVGYLIDPEPRRKGYARQVLETLLAVARAHPDVRVVRATVSPDNYASRSLVEDHGFEAVGDAGDEARACPSSSRPLVERQPLTVY
jgi:ribosomal-protein-alanine N-acetyltransferase